ncbi:hypothetical protein BDQ17DRAFT_676640 [Cyathus striatus]|nr:hypothetical protein BDQ17DRAFT_676640 [Cyathus striatus]
MRATRNRTQRNVKGKRLVDGINEFMVSYCGSNESYEAMLSGMSPLSDVSTLVTTPEPQSPLCDTKRRNDNSNDHALLQAKKCRRFRQEKNLFPQDSRLSSTCAPKFSISRRVSKRCRDADCHADDEVPPEKEPKVQAVQLAVVEEGNFVLRIPRFMPDESVDMDVQISEPPSSRDRGQALRTFSGTLKNAFLFFWL